MAKKRTTGFAARLRELRTSAGLTQSELADRAGMHLHGLTKLEQGDREPAWSTVLDLARALNVDVSAFAEVDQQTAQEAEPQPPAPSPPPRVRPRKDAGQAEPEPPPAKKPRKRRGG